MNILLHIILDILLRPVFRKMDQDQTSRSNCIIQSAVHGPVSVCLVVTLCDYALVLLVNPITDSYEQSYLASRAASSAKTSFFKDTLT